MAEQTDNIESKSDVICDIYAYEAEFIEESEKEVLAELAEQMKKVLLDIHTQEYVDDNWKYWLTGEGYEESCREFDLTPEQERKAPSVYSKIAALYREYKRVEKAHRKVYLFLNVPFPSASRTLELDQIANFLQNEDLYATSHPHLEDPEAREDHDKNPMLHRVVKSKSDIRAALDNIFQEYVMKAMCIKIVVNGEGYGGDKTHPKGSICLSEESNESRYISMEMFMDYVDESWKKTIAKKAAEHHQEREQVASNLTIMERPSEVDGPSNVNTDQPGIPSSTIEVESQPESDQSNENDEFRAQGEASDTLASGMANPSTNDPSGPTNYPIAIGKARDETEVLVSGMANLTTNDDDDLPTDYTDLGIALNEEYILESIPPIPRRVLVVFGQCYSDSFDSERHKTSAWGSERKVVAAGRSDHNEGRTRCRYKYERSLANGLIVIVGVHASEHLDLKRVLQDIK